MVVEELGWDQALWCTGLDRLHNNTLLCRLGLLFQLVMDKVNF